MSRSGTKENRDRNIEDRKMDNPRILRMIFACRRRGKSLKASEHGDDEGTSGGGEGARDARGSD